MTTTIDATEVARNKFVKGELEAGLVYAANASEYQDTDPATAAVFLADAEDCYATALKLLRQSRTIHGSTMELEVLLDELRGRLAISRATRFVTAAA